MGPKMRSSEESSVGSGATSGQGNNGGGGRRGAARNRPRNQNHRQGRGGGGGVSSRPSASDSGGGRDEGGGGERERERERERDRDQGRRRGVGAIFTSRQQREQRQRLVSETGEDSCPVCLNRMHIMSVGMCNHSVCNECSTRMRVLCGQNECPICRQDMPKVVHASSRGRFEDLSNAPFKMDRRSRICFETDEIEAAFHRLLDHRCIVCEEAAAEEGSNATTNSFRTLKLLETHAKREHELFFCDLCLENLKNFTHERRLYTRAQLATHRRKGDPDDTSHRGHPLCEFCQERFVDKDALFLHLRREHFFCHFCEADGFQQYYADYDGLRDHFEADHFLCLEGACREEKFTHAFRSEIDLKAHRADMHSGGLSKAAAKQNRIVELDINYSRHQMNRRRGGRGGSPPDSSDDQPDGPAAQAPSSTVDLSCAAFPTLNGGNDEMVYPSGAPASADGAAGGGEMARRLAMSAGHNVRWSDGRRVPSEQDFPSLPGSRPSSAKQQQQQNNGPAYPLLVRSSNSAASAPSKKRPQEDFPSLGAPTSNSNLGPAAGPAPIYRTHLQQPAWSASSSSGAKPKTSAAAPSRKTPAPAPIIGDDDPPLPKPAVAAMKPKMTTLTKVEKKAPLEASEENFPGLGPSTAADAASAVPAAPAKKAAKKKKPKGIDSIKSEAMAAATVNSESSLSAAAALISLDDAPKSKPEEEKEWATIPKKEKAQQQQQQQQQAKKEASSAASIPGLKFEDAKPKEAPTKSKPPGLQAPPMTTTAAAPRKPASPTEDFPTLGPSAKPMSANFRPAAAQAAPTARAPPPGFGAAAASTIPKASSAPPTAKAPPPGFSKSNFPALGSTTTTSAHAYHNPADFSSRNARLLSTLTGVLGGKSLEFQAFKSASKKFRAGETSTEEYYDTCLDAAGKDAFFAFLPELIALLPDIKKQNELQSIHNRKFAAFKLSGLASCPTCRQIVSRDDVKDHSGSHALDQDFPRLG